MRTVAKRLVRIAVSVLSLWLVATGLRGDGVRWLIASAASNPIAVENSQTGNPASEWDIGGAGDSTIQGFATDISVNTGQTVPSRSRPTRRTTRSNLSPRLLRRQRRAQGRDGGAVGTLPQNQPACVDRRVTGLVDCGTGRLRVLAVDRRRVGHLRRQADPDRHRRVEPHRLHRARRRAPGGRGGADLRHDVAGLQPVRRRKPVLRAGHRRQQRRDGLCGCVPDRATKVSYNRPFDTRAHDARSFLFNAEYPMVRWLEANGYNVKYWAGVDTDRRGADLIGAHKPKAFLSVGHDEYWSGGQRASVESGAQRRRQPGVLQRQRDVLEDAVRAQHRRLEHRLPDAGQLQGNAREREDRSGVDAAGHRSGPARGAIRASARRPTAAARRTA